jgi:transposase
MRYAGKLLEGLCNAYIAGDSAYSSRALAEQLESQGCLVVIPKNPTHPGPRAIDVHLYKERRLIENFFQRIKRWRRIAMRFEKLARNFLGFLYLAATLVWLF